MLRSGTAEVQFESAADLRNVEVWLTPSLEGLEPTPAMFANIQKGTKYTIRLKLQPAPSRTLGGTLHLRVSEDSSRSYAQPLPLVIKVAGGQEDEEDAVVGAVVSSADYRGGSVAPGQVVSLFGRGLGPEVAALARPDGRGRIPAYVGDTQVLFNGLPAPLLAVTRNQVNAVVPQGVAADSSVEVVVTHRGKVSPPVTLPVEAAAPALFALDGSGRGQAAALNQDTSVNGPTNPARRGTVVVLYGSGFGEWREALPDGAIIDSVLPAPKAPVSVTIGGVAARVIYAGGAPGLVSGVVQINAEIPTEVAPGDRVTVVVTAGSRSSSASVTIAVQ